MDMWDECVLTEELERQVESLIDNAGHVLFFKKDGDVFGAGEDSRVVFAKMKNPDDEMPDGWAEDATFSAENLNKAVRGEPAQHVINNEDLKRVEVVDREKAVELLSKEAEKLGDKAFPKKPKFQVIDLARILQKYQSPDEPPNYVRADEE